MRSILIIGATIMLCLNSIFCTWRELRDLLDAASNSQIFSVRVHTSNACVTSLFNSHV